MPCQTEARTRMPRCATAFVVTFVACTAAGCSSSSAPPAPKPETGTICDRCGVCEQHIPPTSANHVLGPIDYPDPPPTGGDHNPCWATWGVHDDVVAPENWVHNLEHGGIVFLYRSKAELDAADATNAGDAGQGGTSAALDALVNRLPRTLSTQYSALPKTFAVVAWGYRLVSDCVDLNAATDFYDAHFNQGLEDIASNPSCN